MSINEIDIQQFRRMISTTAAAMLEGDCSYIEGVRTICRLLEGARIDWFAAPFVTFVAIDSETDAVPIGEVREKWHPEAKVKFQSEWDEAESYAKSMGMPACREAIAWLARYATYRYS